MGNHADPKKKNAQLKTAQAKEEGGKSMNPPAFSLESSPVQMKGGFFEDIYNTAANLAESAMNGIAGWFGSGEGEAKAAPVADTKAAPVAEEKAAPVANENAAPAAETKKDAPVKDAKEGKPDGKALTEYTFDKKDAIDPKTKEKYPQGDLTTLMLKKAGIDPPSNFWSNFTTMNLFGLQTNSLHMDFANLLKNAEAKTVAKMVASQDYLDWAKANGVKDINSPKSVGKFMGLKGGYSTLRGEEPDSASFHAFGMAIDFNVPENPWISDSAGKLDKGSGDKKTRDKTGVLKDALDRAGGLLGQTLEFHHVNPDHFNYDMADTYDNMSKIDKGFETYFGLGLDTKDAELKSFLDKTKDPLWKGKTTQEARDLINKDLDVLSQWWARKDKHKDQSEMIRKNGIMDLDRRMVMSMGEVGLDWGGKYGDMMHFDMRQTGLGRKLYKAKHDKEVKEKKAEMTQKMKDDAKAAAEAKKKAAAEKKAAADAAKNAKK
jgi:hypothetical protein